MTTVATLDTVMRLNSTAFRTGMVEAAAQANQSLSAIQKQATETAGVLNNLQRAAAAFGEFELLKEGLHSLIEAQVQMQQIQYTLQSATGSAADAANAFDFLKKTTDALGLNLQPAAQGFGQLAAAADASGIPISKAEALFTAFAQASTTMHLSSEQSQHALLALTEMMSRGTIQARQLNQQLGFAIPGSAARFKEAVMESVKGTDLAGKSFMQLEQSGALVTSRFLPQLTQALAESGRGWEQASEGLNAQINRLKTSWFNLKNDLSSGLFTDVATSSTAFLAANLDHIASTLGLISGLAGARMLGSTLSSGADKAQQYVQEYQGARMAATAEAAYAAATLDKVKADAVDAADAQGRAQRSLATVRDVEAQARAVRDAAAAEFELQAAVDLTARKNVERLGSAMTLPANVRFQDEASGAAAAAQKALTAAKREYTAAVRDAQAAGMAADALNTKLVESNIALAAAEEAVTAAEARLAAARALETELGSLSNTIRGAAASFGNFALSLVGGPWGLAIAAIGGLAYAIYDVKKASEDYEAETVNQVKSLQTLRTEVQAATDDYGQLGAKMNTSQTLDVFVNAGTSLSKTRGEMADLQAEAARLQEQIQANGSNEGTAILNWFDQRKLDEVNERIAALGATMHDAQSDVDALRDKLSLFGPAVDSVTGAIDRLAHGASLKDVLGNLAGDFNGGLAQMDAAQKAVETGLQGAIKSGDAWEKQAKKIGTTRVAQTQSVLDDLKAEVPKYTKTAAAAAKAIADLETAFAKPLKQAGMADDAEAAKKAATAGATAAREQQQAYLNLKASQDGQLQSLQDQVDGDGKATSAQKALNVMLAGGNAAFRRLSETEKAEAIAKQQRIVDLTDEAAAQKEATKEAQAFAVVQENLARLSIESSRKHGDVLASIGQGTKESADNAALQATLRQYDDLITQAGKANTKGEISDDLYAKEVAEYKKALGEQLAADKTYFAERDALQSDWHNGARAAMQDYVDQSANAAAEAQQLFANAFTSMENALLTFVTTGKFGFKSFVTSVLTDLARMELRVVESQILQSILGMFLMQSPIMSNSSIGANMDSSVSGDIAGYQSSMSTIPVAGGRASGGPVQGGNLYEVAEGGKPEMLVSGGRSYLLMGADGGHVIPAGGSSSTSSASGAPTNVNVSINVVQDANGNTQMNSHTEALTQFGKQMAAEMETAARRVMSRGLQPGGDIYKTLRMGAPA